MGKSAESGASKIYDYYGDAVGLVCRGPVIGIAAVIVEDFQAWPAARNWKAGENYVVGNLRKYGGLTWECTANHTSATNNAPPDATKWTLYYFAATGDSDSIDVPKRGTMHLRWGTDTQTVHPILEAAGNNLGHLHPAYKGWFYVVLDHWYFGRERPSSPNVRVVPICKPVQSVVGSDPADLIDFQANVIPIACEFLTSDNGLGIDPARINATSAQAAADTLHDNQSLAAISYLLTEAKTFRSIWDDLRSVSDAWVRFNAEDKVIEFGVYSHGEPPASYHTLTIDDFADGERPKFKSDGWTQVKTRALVEFSDRSRAFKNTAAPPASDLRAYRVLGEHREMTLQRDFITRLSQAMAHGAETLKTLGRPQLSTPPIKVRREKARNILPGDYVLIDIDLEPGGAQLLQFFRVRGRQIPRDGAITLEVEADASLAPIPWSGEGTPPIEVDEEVPAIDNARFVETPPSMANGDFSVIALIERPDALITGAKVHYDSDTGGDFMQLGATPGFATRATLRSDVGSGDGTIEIDLPAQVDEDRLSLQPGDIGAANDQLLVILVEIDSGQVAEDGSGFSHFEVLSISAQDLVSGNDYDLTVLRGRMGTTARAFTAAACEVWIIPRSSLVAFDHGDFDSFRANRSAATTPDNCFFRLQPSTFVAERELSDCDSIEFVFPAAVQIGPELVLSSPGSVSQSVTSPYPATVSVTGTASDANGNLIGWSVSVRKSTESDEQKVHNEAFVPTTERAFDVDVQIEQAGTFYIYVRAFDNAGLKKEIVITVAAAAGAAKVARPRFYYQNVKLPTNATLLHVSTLELRCETPGATIKWWYEDFSGTHQSSEVTYDPENPETWPQHSTEDVPPSTNPAARIKAQARKIGMTSSATNSVNY